jgi:hypothetical protein
MMNNRGGMGVGHSLETDPMSAAHDACAAALAGRTPEAGDLMILFPTIQYDQAALFDAAREVAGPGDVVGCSAFSSFTRDAQVGQGTVAAFLPSGDLSFGVAGVDGVGSDIYGAAREVTQLALDEAGGEADHSALMILSDGLVGDQREVVRGAYAVTGASVPLVGGAAGNDQQIGYTVQSAGSKVMTNGLAAVWINSPTPLGVGVGHGWRPVGEPMIVTRADRNIVYELDGQPAVQAYLAQRTARPLGTNLSGEGEVSFSASTLDEPLGLANVSGGYDVRHILYRTKNDGLLLFGHVNEQSVVQAMVGHWSDLVDAAEGAAGDATAQRTGDPHGALVFSCTGRIAPLGHHVTREADAISAAIGATPMAGFFTYGEFARVTGSTGFHNATVVVLAL